MSRVFIASQQPTPADPVAITDPVATTDPVVTAASAPALGLVRPLIVGRDISPAEAARLSGEGLLARCLADVVVCADAWLDLEARAECLGLLMRHEGAEPADWVVGHEAAAWAHGGAVDPGGDPAHPGAAGTALERIVVLGPRGRSVRYVGVLVHRQSSLDDDEILEVSRIRLTSPARTAGDLLRHLPPVNARAALDGLRAATAVTPSEIERSLQRRPGARGLARARRILREWAAGDDPPQAGGSG